MLGNRLQIVNVNTPVRPTDECNENFKAFWKTEAHNNNVQTSSGSSNHSCSCCLILEQPSDLSCCNGITIIIAVKFWHSVCSRSLTTLGQKVLTDLRSTSLALHPSSSSFSK